MNYLSEIKKYYLYNFFVTFNLSVPILVLFLDESGLNYSQMMLLMVVQNLTSLVVELPGGVFADKIGRKKILILSTLFKMIGNLIYFYGGHMGVFLVGSALFGAGRSFESGCDSAFLYDTLKENKKESDYKIHEGNAYAFRMLGFGVGSIIGGLFHGPLMKYTFLITFFLYSISLISCFWFREPKRTKVETTIPTGTSRLAHLKEAWEMCPLPIRSIILFHGILYALIMISHRFLQPYMKDVGIPVEYFGWIYFVWLCISAWASKMAYYLERKWGNFISLLLIPLSLGTHLLIMGSQKNFVGALFIIFGEFAFGIIRPVISHLINKEVDSEHRATVLSFAGVSQYLFLIFLSPFFGHLADQSGYMTSLVWMGVVSLGAGVPLALFIKGLGFFKKVPVA